MVTRHNKKDSDLSYIKVPLQGLSKSGKTVFAYMRRSTTKEEQGNSLIQQEEMIDRITKELGIDMAEVNAYIESKSGFENKTRKEFERMIEDIDKTSGGCILLCRDSARLSRNENDSLRIANRIFGDNKTPKKIKSIFFYRDYEIEEWNDKSDKEKIKTELFNNYLFSIRNGKICFQGTLRKFDKGEFPRKPPHGLSKVNLKGEGPVKRNEPTILRQNDKMPFIRHAFEMKEKGRTALEICRYLKQYAKINISTKNIIETVISNTVYKGEYTEIKTGTIFNKIKFWEGKPPIDRELWEKANAKVGKRGFGFGEGQAEHIAPGILKFESGKNLYMYKAKGKHNAYQTEIKGENGKRKSIGIMESRLVKEFLYYAIPRILNISRKIEAQLSVGFIEKQEGFIKNFLDKYKSGVVIPMLNITEKTSENITDGGISARISDIRYNESGDIEIGFLVPRTIDEKTYTLLEDRAKKDLINILKESPTIGIMQDEKETKQIKMKELEGKKQALEEEKKNIDKKAFKLGYNADIANEMKQDTEKEIMEIQAQIDLLSESTNIEEYLDRLPEILLDLHELSSRVLTEADYMDWRDDIKQLMELVSHELILNNKKELKVKLFEGLEKLETEEMGNGRTNRKGYIRLSIYHKMRKRQYGNRWMTQFVPLCREEVRRLEESYKLRHLPTAGKSVQDYLEDMENSSLHTNSMHGVTL